LVGANGSGKTSLLRVMAGELPPSSGTLSRPTSIGYLKQDEFAHSLQSIADLFGMKDQLNVLERAANGTATIEELGAADWTLETRLEHALSRVGLDAPSTAILSELSGGQRTRAGLAALLFGEPDALLLDEPTNHLDTEARKAIMDVIGAWPGCVVVASHDRSLLDMMDTIVEIGRSGTRTYGGNFQHYETVRTAERDAAKAALDRTARDLKATHARARKAAERKARSDRQGRSHRASGSQSKILLNAARDRSEGSDASSARIRSRQLETAEAAVEAAQGAVDIVQALVMDVPPSGLAANKDVLSVIGLCFGYSPGIPVLAGVHLNIRGPERIAVRGRNGSGKSTLLGCITGALSAQSGDVSVKVESAFLDQDATVLRDEETVLEALMRLDPDAYENDARASLARFRFRGRDAEQPIGHLSGGQKLRAALACTLGRSDPCQLLILDEPTNHLDIETVEVLEAALQSYDGALLVVSHDEHFLTRIDISRTVEL
jgi:ATPase subunit of ABC transporter with duplicated ATPase domains